MNIYYVYLYIDPETKLPFYVGIGKGNRYLSHIKEATKQIKTKSKNLHKINKILKILKNGKYPIIDFVAKNISKKAASDLEIFLISSFGRVDLNTGILTNLTGGGDGVRNISDKFRKEMSNRQKGYISAKNPVTGELFKVKKDDPRWIRGELVGQNYKSVNSNKNGKLSGYILAKNPLTGELFKVKKNDPRWISGELVGINKGVPCPENTRLSASIVNKGKPKKEETKKKLSEINKNLKWYHNFETGETKRFIENKELAGYVRVSGPHKKIPL